MTAAAGWQRIVWQAAGLDETIRAMVSKENRGPKLLALPTRHNDMILAGFN